MTRAILSISEASIVRQPFFVLEGPDGERLACRWTPPAPGEGAGRPFETIRPPAGPDAGRTRGVFGDGGFRLLTSADRDVDLLWRGDLNSVLDSGHDWCLCGGRVEICELALDEDLVGLARAA